MNTLSNSLAHMKLKPAFLKPRSKPPQPEKSETTFIILPRVNPNQLN